MQWCETIESVVDEAELIFVAVQTPHDERFEGVTQLPAERADFDYTYLVNAVTKIAEHCKELDEPKTVAVISTCLPGTFEKYIRHLLNDKIDYVYTPQFIAMGTVLADYLNPEFFLVGGENERAKNHLLDLYSQLGVDPKTPAVVTDIMTAEGIKVSYNTWITAKTVIANAWGELCERMGMDFEGLKLAWDMSTKRLISTRYMDAGMSDGGGCHPRDNIALSWLAEQVGMSHNIWDDLMRAREDYEAWHADLAQIAAEELELPLVLLGTAFKPETDIKTGSPALLVANLLRARGVQFLHVDDLDLPQRAVYFIATQNARYADYLFPVGSVVLDPFGYIPEREGVKVRWLGRS